MDTESFLDALYSAPSFRLTHLNLSKSYLDPAIIPRIFSSPQIIHLRSLALNCNPLVKKDIIEQLSDSLQTKNLQTLELRHLGLTNHDLSALCRGKWLGELDRFDIRCNPFLKLENILRCEGVELQGLRGVRHLLMDKDVLNSLNRN